MSIFDVFARSPLGPLQNHMETVNECVQSLDPFFGAVLKQDWAQVETIQQEISNLERQADKIKKNIRLHLPNSLLLPAVPRADILGLVAEQDGLANTSKNIAGIVFGRKIIIPEPLHFQFREYLISTLAAANQANSAVHELDKLLESGFRGKEVAFVENMIHELDQIEHQSDEFQVEVRKILFELEPTLKPVDVIFLYKVIHWIGKVADGAQNVGERLQLLLAR